MNISSISNSLNINKMNNNIQLQKSDATTNTTKPKSMTKIDAMSSATMSTGGDHSFEAKA